MSTFQDEVKQLISASGRNDALQEASRSWMEESIRAKYSYCFSWLGRPIIQYPQDMVAMQEVIWKVRPDLIVETGIAHGGSLVMSASMLAMLDLCDAIAAGKTLDPSRSSRAVLGIDIDIRKHNRTAIEAHPMASRIRMIEGSSVDSGVVERVRQVARDFRTVLVCLDSNHTHEHVLAELRAYAPLASVESYCVVFDTVVERVPKSMYPDRPWGPGNNPMTAVHEYLRENGDFEIDRAIHDQLMLTVAPDGYLRRVR